MSQDPARWTDADVLDHLTASVPELGPFGDPDALLGGLLNDAWRIPAEGAEKGSVVLKVAPPHAADHPEIALDPARIEFEARALQALGPEGKLADVMNERARAPRLIHSDAERHALVMEDLGARADLATWADTADKTPATELGTRLGAFIGRLHAQTLGDDEIAQAFDNRAAQTTRKKVQYDAVEGLLRELDTPDAGPLGAVAREVGERFLKPGRCLIMGDLWPASILVGETEEGPHAGVIDWELTHYGNPAQDLGHIGAHVWMLTQDAERAAQRQTLALILTAIYEGYAEAAGDALPELLGGDVLIEAAVHAGCEILVRAAGTFQEGSPYEGLTRDDDPVREAVLHALTLLRRPERASFVTPLRIALL